MSNPPQNLVYNWIKRYQKLEKGYKFQVKLKRKYVKEVRRLKNIVRADEILLRKLNRNSIPIE